MKIGLAQIHSIPGGLEENFDKHLRFIRQAQEERLDLIVFPEMSLSSYGTQNARAWAEQIKNLDWRPLQKLIDSSRALAVIGVPHLGEDGVEIAQYIFRPKAERSCYSKQLLHDDEKPYFTAGKKTNIIEIGERKIALGICYESLQEEHLKKSINQGAEVYVASQAKDKKGLLKAHNYFELMSSKHNLSCLMVNSIGPCADFHCAGQSAIFTAGVDPLVSSSFEEDLLLYEWP